MAAAAQPGPAPGPCQGLLTHSLPRGPGRGVPGPTLGASSELCWSTVYRICMLLGFRALESSLKITNLIVVPRLSLCAFSSSLGTARQRELERLPPTPHAPGGHAPPTPAPVARAPRAPDAEHVVVQQDLGLEADLDQVGDDVHVLGAVRAAVHAHGHEQVLGGPRQLRTAGWGRRVSPTASGAGRAPRARASAPSPWGSAATSPASARSSAAPPCSRRWR